jgi:hypothetical protein
MNNKNMTEDEKRSMSSQFGIESIAGYLEFCAQAIVDMEADKGNVNRCFSAILALNHIPDWLQYKLTSSQRIQLKLNEKEGKPVKNSYEEKNKKLELLRHISNGLKHLQHNDVSTDNIINSYGSEPFGTGPYGVSYLLIDRGENFLPEERYCTVLKLCQETLAFWKDELEPILQNE